MGWASDLEWIQDFLKEEERGSDGISTSYEEMVDRYTYE